MKGGVPEYMKDLTTKFQTPLSILSGGAIILAIVYQRDIPVSIKLQSTTALGKFFLFLLTIYIGVEISWLHGLLMALLVSVVLATSPQKLAQEGFLGDLADTKFVGDNKRRWFVEQVLKENPLGVQKESVNTQAAQ
jgi:hypothetical protein